MTPRYAELQCVSNYSFLEGASHAAELVHQAALAGLSAIGIADRNSVAGVVRAHIAAREAGLRLLVGARLDLMDGASLIERIRQESQVPVIVMTGFRGSYIAGLSNLPGVNILDKPFEAQSLVDLVESELAAARARAEASDPAEPDAPISEGTVIDEIPM